MRPGKQPPRTRVLLRLVLSIAVCLCWSCRSGSDAPAATGDEPQSLAGHEACARAFEQLAVEPPARRGAIVAETCFDWVADEACAAGLRVGELDAEPCFDRYCPDLQGVVEGADFFCDSEQRSLLPPTLRAQAHAYVVAAAAVDASGGGESALRAVTGRLASLFEDLSLAAPDQRTSIAARFVAESIEASRQIDTVAGMLLLGTAE